MRLRKLATSLLLVLVALGVVWAGVGYWAVPRLVRSLATATVQDTLHRTLSVGDIRFNPWRLELAIDQLSLPDADGKPMLAWQALRVNLRLWPSLWMRGVHLDALQIDGLAVQAVIGKDGQINLADLAKLAGPDQPDDSPPRLAIDLLTVTGGQIGVQELDRPQAFALRLSPIRFELNHFSTVGSSRNGRVWWLADVAIAEAVWCYDHSVQRAGSILVIWLGNCPCS